MPRSLVPSKSFGKPTGIPFTAMDESFPPWAQHWGDLIGPIALVVAIGLGALVLQRLAWQLIQRVGRSYSLPPELLIGTRRVSAFLIYATALLIVLERLGVSGSVLWTAFTGFAAVAAVAFFAAWSVLSNIFCTMLIFATRPFRLLDHIELVESGDKPGMKGRVSDINLIFTTLEEIDGAGQATGSVLQVPNSLFFQRAVRRWTTSGVPQPWRGGEDGADGARP